mgnify:CR=1 FL=1
MKVPGLIDRLERMIENVGKDELFAGYTDFGEAAVGFISEVE